MFPILRNDLNFVPLGSYDRSPFAFKETWNRTAFCAVVCLVMLVLSTICATLLTDPILASGLLDHVYQPKGIIFGVVLCLVIYTVRDFLVAYHADIVMNLRIAQANHWMSNGSYVINTTDGISSFSMGQALMLTSRAKDSEDGLHVTCIVVVEGSPRLITACVDSACLVIGNAYDDIDKIRSMLDHATGEWRYEVAAVIGITFGKHDVEATGMTGKPARTPTKKATQSGPLSTPGALKDLSVHASKH